MKFLLSMLMAVGAVSAAHNIFDYGHVTQGRSNGTVEQEFENTNAMLKALLAANNSADRVVEIPKGSVITMMAWNISSLYDITIKLDGDVYATKYWKQWPRTPSGDRMHFWQFYYCDGIKIEGSGMMDGQGYMWWWREIL